jgi:hypothetical protein
MEYRLIRHTLTGERLVVGADGFVSAPLRAADYLTEDAEPRADWWRVPRPEFNTALWEHPLWAIEARMAEPAPPWYDPAPRPAARRVVAVAA